MTIPVSFHMQRSTRLWFKQAFAITLCILAFAALAPAQSWTSLTNSPGFNANTALLLTDGTVMVQQGQTGHWSRLTPDGFGSYINGTWSQLADMPAGYGPLYFASAVLPDGRVVAVGGEFNVNGESDTTRGAIYNPATNTWTSITPPSGVTQIGDASSVILPNGTFMLGPCCNQTTDYLLNASTLTWSPTGSTGKADVNSEEGWALLPNGKVLTVDTENGTNSELFNPSTGSWSSAGSTIVTLPSNGGQFIVPELGPAVLRPDGTVFALGATSNTAIYNSNTGSWSAGPTFANGLDVADGPAALLPNGNVLVDASPGVFNPGSQFFEFNGTNLLSVPAPANASAHSSFEGRMVVLPSGQVLFTDGSTTVQVYTPSGTFQSSWRPTISSVASSLNPGSANNAISGTQFNGLSQGAMYGDDAQSATNYPLVRITNNSTGHIFYAKTHNHSTMGVATGAATVSTQFDVPSAVEAGPSTLQVVANGIPSAAVAVTIAGPPAPGRGTVTITGFEQSDENGNCDSGVIYVIVNGVESDTPYSSAGGTCDGVLPGFYAQYLANAINQGNPYVSAQWNGDYNTAVINLTARTSGANTNYSLSSGSYSQSFPIFNPPSYAATPSGPALTGGHN